MKRLLLALLCLPSLLTAQRIDIDVFGGMANYQGDLQEHFFTTQNAKPAGAIMVKWALTDQLYIRTGFSFASLYGDDKNNIPKNRSRNLNFQSNLQEYSLGLEYRLFSPDKFPFTPYVFIGGGAFHFNPYTYYYGTGESQKVYLQPLSTEGQRLSQYPNTKPYKLTQFCLPYGFGMKWQINCNLNAGLELRHTKTFTDYLDDVSGSYAAASDLLAAKGQLSVDLAYRGDEYNNSNRPYPQKGSQRGNPKLGDLYYFAGITLGLRLNDCDGRGFSLGGLFNGPRSLFHKNGSRNRQLDCPRF